MRLEETLLSELTSALELVGPRIAVAVSGGADSVALALLLREAAPDLNITALSVDHGLREEAAQECLWVRDVMTRHNISHVTLKWTGGKPTKDLQKAARDARYGLMFDWCRDNGISDLFVAHHLDDQAETFVLRLARGSGVDGLAAMQKVTDIAGMRLLRPLLDVPKSRLVDYLHQREQTWIEDPSNQNTQFERVKVRQSKETLESLGLSAHRLAMTAQAMARAKQAMDRITDQYLASHLTMFEAGYAQLSRDGLEALDEEILFRALSRIGQAISGEVYPPRLDRLKRLSRQLLTGQDATLMRCRWIVAHENILICREIRRMHVPENLYSIENKKEIKGLRQRVLGEDGWAQIKRFVVKQGDHGMPVPAVYALLSFWDEDGVCLVPHLGYKRNDMNFEVEVTLNHAEALFRLARDVK